MILAAAHSSSSGIWVVLIVLSGGFVALMTHPFRPPPDLDIFVTMEVKGDAGRASVVSR
jgi:hypothetical protein